MIQLIRPTPMNAPRQARRASPSSERRGPGTTAINRNLFNKGQSPRFIFGFQGLECANTTGSDPNRPMKSQLTIKYIERVGPNMEKGAARQRGPFYVVTRGGCGRHGSEFSTATHKAHDHKQDDGADRGIDDLRHQAGAEMNAESGKQPACDQRAGDADHDVADDAKSSAADDLAGEPACNQADEEDDKQALVGQYHEYSPQRFLPRKRPRDRRGVYP